MLQVLDMHNFVEIHHLDFFIWSFTNLMGGWWPGTFHLINVPKLLNYYVTLESVQETIMLLKIIKWSWVIETHPIECWFTITEHGSHAQPKLDSTQEKCFTNTLSIYILLYTRQTPIDIMNGINFFFSGIGTRTYCSCAEKMCRLKAWRKSISLPTRPIILLCLDPKFNSNGKSGHFSSLFEPHQNFKKACKKESSSWGFIC